MMRKTLFIGFFFLNFIGANSLAAQNIIYAHNVLDTLCSKTMFGRACNKKGDSIAAEFIANEFKKHNLVSFTSNYKQFFSIQCNEIKDVFCALGHPDSILCAGEDYVVLGASPSSKIIVKGSNPIYFKTVKDWDKFSKKERLNNQIILFDAKEFPLYTLSRKVFMDLKQKEITPKLIISQNNGKLSFNIGRSQIKYPVLFLRNTLLSQKKIEYLRLDVDAEYHPNHLTQNIVGYVKGKSQPDSFFTFVSHYDHLGGMGNEVYFPGANDNASSVALLLDLASHYTKPENQPDYSILFIATAAEELGLLGAEHYAQNPYVALSSMKFLINMDMNGTGSGGFHLVHGLIEQKAASLIEKINQENYYFRKIISAGEANNSDHYPFYKRSVPCLFVFTSGCEFNEYHSIYDNAEDLPFTKYESLFSLLTDFIKQY